MKPYGYIAQTLVVLLGALSAAPAWPQEDDAQARLAVLRQQAGAVLEEATELVLTDRRIRQQSAELSATEESLDADKAAIRHEVIRYNQAATELSSAVAAHRERCPRGLTGNDAIDRCNDAAAELIGQGEQLNQRRDALTSQRNQLNQRVAAYEQSRQQWRAAKRERALRSNRNETETRRLIASMPAFQASEAFADLSHAAGEPAACASAKLSAVRDLRPIDLIKRFQDCLDALASSR